MGKPFLIELPITVKTYDIDFLNIVHNMVYIRWLEDLRFQMLADYLPLESLLADGISPVLLKTEIEYRWAVRLGDPVVGQMWMAELQNTRWILEAEISVGDKIAAWARQTGFFADLKTVRPARMPKALREQWQAVQTKISK
ncbi:MAG: acyl-CoA thioesterase [Anaerolineae bacterium]|nr:acyl-CoA thioesterase [Anaerolineae bacterium]